MNGSLGRAAAAALVVPALCVGCSISASLESASDSISTALESVSDSLTSPSDSSGGGDSAAKDAALYRADLCAYTLAYVGAEDHAAEDAELVRAIGQIAQAHGITDWEGNGNTVAALREAVASGAIDANGVERLRRELGMLGPRWVDAALPPAPTSSPATGSAR